jgi:hypothetical protein
MEVLPSKRVGDEEDEPERLFLLCCPFRRFRVGDRGAVRLPLLFGEDDVTGVDRLLLRVGDLQCLDGVLRCQPVKGANIRDECH